MENSDEVVQVINVEITRESLKSLITLLNYREHNETERELTIEEVLSNPNLLKYVCAGFIEGPIKLVGFLDLLNNDTWCDLNKYR